VSTHAKQRGGKFLDALQGLVIKDVIKSPSVQHLEFKGQGMVVAVFETMQSDPSRLLPSGTLARFEKITAICESSAISSRA
jgi:dGTP triphosphohydrolase